MEAQLVHDGVHDKDRRRLRLLDWCLSLLEEANERDELRVSASLAAAIAGYVPNVSAGMRVSDAIELVLGEQEQYMHRPDGGTSLGLVESAAVHGDAVLAPLSEADARALTEKIKRATRQVCLLLLDAHARRAWAVLGYQTWEQYVHAEFGLSRSRSYQLLDQGRVILTIKSSAAIEGALDIHPYAAAQIKSRLSEIAEIVRQRTAGCTESEAQEIVAEVIAAQRSAARRLRQLRGRTDGDDVARLATLYRAIAELSRMPSAAEAAAMVPDQDASKLAELEQVLDWLTRFRQEWSRRQVETTAPVAG